MAMTASNILLQQQILLESGTNELELLVFRIADHAFGVNVAKVRSVITMAQFTPLHRAHPSVLGVFRLRDVVMPCVSLARHLAIAEVSSEKTVLVTELNQQQLAFAIDAVERIHRLSWEKVLSLPPLAEFASSPVTAIANIDGRLVLMLDLESIHARISDQLHNPAEVPNPSAIPRGSKRLLVAEDSPTVRNAVRETLKASGYVNVRMFENGLAAWNFIEESARASGGWQAAGDLLVTDIEMPQMDGLHLTKKIKDSALLNGLPVLLYSSIVTADNQKKGKAVGADAQIAKTELHRIVEWADKLTKSEPNSTSETRRPSAIASASTPVLKASSPTESHGATKGSPAPKPKPSTAPSESRPNTAVPSPTESLVEPTDRALWRTFCEEMWDRIVALQDGVDEEGVGDPVETGTRLYRAVHSIKSAASVIPLPPVVAAAHALEERLSQAQSKRCDVPWLWVSAFADWLTELIRAADVAAYLAKFPTPAGAQARQGSRT